MYQRLPNFENADPVAWVSMYAVLHEVLTWYAAHLPGGPSVTSNTVGFSMPVNNKGKAALTA